MNILPAVVGTFPQSWIKTISRLQWKHPRLKQMHDWCAMWFRNQDGTIQQGVGRGLRFNCGESAAGYLLGTSEPAVQQALERLVSPGMCVYDVGANVGFLSMISARLVGARGNVICFEPLLSNAQQIEHNVRLNSFSQVVVRTEALGISDGEAEFLVSSEPFLGRLASTAPSVTQQIGRTVVTVRKLDTVIEQIGFRRPDLIKIDTEGAEADVLAGAHQTIRRERPLLLVELHGTNSTVSKILSSLDYHAVVLGSSDDISDSPWDAFVVAAPAERKDLVRAVDQLRGIKI